MEESNLMITGPPASRTVIDNLKKLLLQRQHSRESDTEVGGNQKVAYLLAHSHSTFNELPECKHGYVNFSLLISP